MVSTHHSRQVQPGEQARVGLWWVKRRFAPAGPCVRACTVKRWFPCACVYVQRDAMGRPPCKDTSVALVRSHADGALAEAYFTSVSAFHIQLLGARLPPRWSLSCFLGTDRLVGDRLSVRNIAPGDTSAACSSCLGMTHCIFTGVAGSLLPGIRGASPQVFVFVFACLVFTR